MSIQDSIHKITHGNTKWPKITAAVAAGAVGVWSWVSNKPDPETGKKSMLKTAVTVGGLTTAAALGVSAYRGGSFREAIREAKHSEGWEKVTSAAKRAFNEKGAGPGGRRV